MIGIINYRVYLNKFTIVILTYSLSYISAYAATSNDIANGIAAYNKGWYSIALKYLTAAESQYPNDALLRYYKANTLVHLTKMPEAIAEYTESSKLDPNGTTGSYAREALQAAGVQPATSPSVFHANVSATTQTLLEQANEQQLFTTAWANKFNQ